jgi:hypothetical protein
MLASPASHPPPGSRLTPEQRARKSHLALTVIAIGAAVVAMVKCACRDCNGR